MGLNLIESEAEWIGSVPSDWKITEIGQIYSERREKVNDTDFPPLSVTMQGIVPQLSNVAKSDAHDNRKKVCKGDFVINSRSDRRGSCGIAYEDGSVSLINTVLEPRGEMNPDYYNWLFHTSMFADEFFKWGHGIVEDLWTTNWSDMKKIHIPKPSLETQKKIADYLAFNVSEIDKIIEKTKDSIVEYKKLRVAMITKCVIYGVKDDSDTQDSEVEWMGEVPAGWTKSTVLRNIDFIGGSQPPLTEFISEEKEGYVRLIQNRDYRTDAYKVYVPEKLVTKFCEVDDVMIGRYGPPIFVIHRGLKGAYNVALMKAVPNGIDREFMYYYLQNSTLLSYIESFSLRTAGQSGVNPSILKSFPMFIPTEQEQKEIAIYLKEKCEAIDVLIEKKTQLLYELEEYRKSIIYEYVTGKRRVK